MNETVINATVGDALIHISDQVGMGLQQIFVVYTKAQMWIGLSTSLQIGISLSIWAIGAYLIYRFLRKNVKKAFPYPERPEPTGSPAVHEHNEERYQKRVMSAYNKNQEDKLMCLGIAIATSGLIALIMFMVLGLLFSSIGRMIVPEYYALQDLISMVGGAL